MTSSHDLALERLLASPAAADDAEAAAAREHVARCPWCWEVVRACHVAQFGAPPMEAERMAAAFGCDAVRDALYLLAHDPLAAPPAVARHVGWCVDCRERLRELLAFTRAERGWRDVAARLVARVGRGVAAFAALAEEVAVLATVAAPEPVRDEPDRTADWHGEPAAVRVVLVPPGATAQLAIAADGDGRVRLAVEPPAGTTAVTVRADDDRGRLLASQPVGRAPVEFRHLPAGRHRLGFEPSGATIAIAVVRDPD